MWNRKSNSYTIITGITHIPEYIFFPLVVLCWFILRVSAVLYLFCKYRIALHFSKWFRPGDSSCPYLAPRFSSVWISSYQAEYLSAQYDLSSLKSDQSHDAFLLYPVWRTRANYLMLTLFFIFLKLILYIYLAHGKHWKLSMIMCRK